MLYRQGRGHVLPRPATHAAQRASRRGEVLQQHLPNQLAGRGAERVGQQEEDPMEIPFMAEMCVGYPERVKDELLKVRSPSEIYPKASYYN